MCVRRGMHVCPWISEYDVCMTIKEAVYEVEQML